jgi:hypothetical protein
VISVPRFSAKTCGAFSSSVRSRLASMLEPPLGPWSEDFPSQAKALKQAPFAAQWKRRPGIVRHGFTGTRGSMPPVGDTWTQEEVDALAAYVKRNIYKAAPTGSTGGG